MEITFLTGLGARHERYDNLRKIREAAHPIVERQINTLWCVNLICMTAFRHGFIDEISTSQSAIATKLAAL